MTSKWKIGSFFSRYMTTADMSKIMAHGPDPLLSIIFSLKKHLQITNFVICNTKSGLNLYLHSKALHSEL